MSFQIVALALDANDNVIERKVVPYPLSDPPRGDGNS